MMTRTLDEIESNAVGQLEGITDDTLTRGLIREAHALGRREGAEEMRERAAKRLAEQGDLWAKNDPDLARGYWSSASAVRSLPLPLPDDAKETR